MSSSNVRHDSTAPVIVDPETYSTDVLDGCVNPAYQEHFTKKVEDGTPPEKEGRQQSEKAWSPGGRGDPYRGYRYGHQVVLVVVWICIVRSKISLWLRKHVKEE